MLNLKSKIENKESGFTLVELLVVILIIGVLAAIAIPVFLNQRKSANEAALKSDIHTLELAMQNCAIKQQGAYPDIQINWGGVTTTPPACLSGIKLSNTTDTHSYDFGVYHPNFGLKPGDAYCIEAYNDGAGVGYYFRSDKGVISTILCENQ
jgi:type IV pilus assembly protein PilA